MKAIAAQLAIQYPGSNKGRARACSRCPKSSLGHMKPVLLTLLAASGLLLLIASRQCGQPASRRSESRRREIAVRGALGATSARLSRQFVTEGLLLAAAGCLAAASSYDLDDDDSDNPDPKAVAANIPFLAHVGFNVHIALFAGCVALLAAGLMALTPILRLSFQDIREGLGDGGRSAAGRFWQRMGANLVVVELSIAVVLLVGAGLARQELLSSPSRRHSASMLRISRLCRWPRRINPMPNPSKK